jgi:lysophospholipase L1-like esterase
MSVILGRFPVLARRVAAIAALVALACTTWGAARASALGGMYVALGDSYTSGPLIPNQHGTPIGCWRSDHNYPSLVAASLRPSGFRDVSCASAVTADMTKPQSVPLGGVNPPQLGALSPDTTLVTVGIGGNDADLVGIAEACVTIDLLSPTGSPCQRHYTVSGRDVAAAGVDAIAPRIAAVLRGIHARSPRAQTLLVGYPAVLPLSGPGCWPLVPLSAGDVPWFRSLLVRINHVLAVQAATNGAKYVDTYTPSAGHDVCRLPGKKWFEGVIPTSLAFPLHPNALGEASMGGSVLGALGRSPAPTGMLARPRVAAHGWAAPGGTVTATSHARHGLRAGSAQSRLRR